MFMRFVTLALGKWQLVAAVLLALSITHGCVYAKGRSDGAAKVEAAYDKARLEAEVKARKADARASARREQDADANRQAEDNRNEAINATPDDPRHALNCERLRQAGVVLDPATTGC
tara:strand:- start:3647 stop:3997 length:351 start_codon:yes stop_codon:yes gene_type:complete